ncbi:hypothetical protein SRABI96_00437 [Peribacillus sp. Bi96]|nr:hypothetical protein SRABI96_00437 [Peribacillus sp. Bi96]
MEVIKLEVIILDQLVPANHLVRIMEAAIDFSFIYDLVKNMYSEVGRLQDEINQDRENHEKKPFPPDKFDKEETKEIKESTTDPESGYYVKDERTKQFAYSFHAAADRNGFALGTIVTPGNTHDCHILEPIVEQVIEKVGKPEAVAADAAYKTPAITNYLLSKEITPALPYTHPRTKEGFFRKHDHVYYEHFDCYLCPSGEILKYSTTNKEGYHENKVVQHAHLYHGVQKAKTIKKW